MRDSTKRKLIRLALLAIEGVCFYCGRDLTATGVFSTLDHLVPRCRGGTDAIANLRLSCFRCNQRKADQTPAELAVHVHRHVLSRKERRRHFAKNARRRRWALAHRRATSADEGD